MHFNLGSPSKRFWRLVRERDERDLSVSELQFLDEHRNQSVEDSSLEVAENHALGALRAERMEPKISEDFNARVLREYRLVKTEKSTSRAQPVLIAAGITAIAFFAILEALSGSLIDNGPWRNSEARNTPRQGIVFPQPNLYAPESTNIR